MGKEDREHDYFENIGKKDPRDTPEWREAREKARKVVVPVSGTHTYTPLADLTDRDLAGKEGKFRLPGDLPGQERELVGIVPAALEEQREKALEARRIVERDLKSEWRCVLCKRVTGGRDVQVRKPERDGDEALYVCPRCGGPVVRMG